MSNTFLIKFSFKKLSKKHYFTSKLGNPQQFTTGSHGEQDSGVLKDSCFHSL